MNIVERRALATGNRLTTKRFQHVKRQKSLVSVEGMYEPLYPLTVLHEVRRRLNRRLRAVMVSHGHSSLLLVHRILLYAAVIFFDLQLLLSESSVRVFVDRASILSRFLFLPGSGNICEDLFSKWVKLRVHFREHTAQLKVRSRYYKQKTILYILKLAQEMISLLSILVAVTGWDAEAL
jgi:hypothetical protein